LNPLRIRLDMEPPKALTDAVSGAERIVALTGAGVSAESGVPTFRDARTGLWEQHDPLELATAEGFERNPSLVWDWYQWRRQLIAQSRPNPAHHALAELETRIDTFTLITQNVDGLHQLAGSHKVLELHGNIGRSICSRTRRLVDEEWLARHSERSPVPSPHHPCGLARPDVVWFGEALDAGILDAAFTAATRCKLMLVIGTSGAVHPAAGIPLHALNHGALMIEINPVAGELTRHAHWHLQGTAAHWLPRLLAARDN